MSLFARLDRRFVSWLVPRYQFGFSQFGEDKIVRKLLWRMGVKDVYYLDIGANDPIFNNNTYLLYCRGHKGVCVEANPAMAAQIRRDRPRDICLNVGACGVATVDSLPFHVVSSNVLISFSKEVASATEKNSHTIDIKIMAIGQILAEVCERPPNFVSLDVEGVEEEILLGFDFQKFRPQVVCIETRDLQGNRQQGLLDLMTERGYLPIAETYVNTLFVENQEWLRAHESWQRSQEKNHPVRGRTSANVHAIETAIANDGLWRRSFFALGPAEFFSLDRVTAD